MTESLFNGMFAKLMSRALIIGVDEANQTLSQSQYKENTAFQITGADTAGKTVTVPAAVRVSVWQSDEANAEDVTIKCGTGTVSIEPGQRITVVTDGTANGIAASELTGTVGSVAWQSITGDHTAAAGEQLEFKLTAAARLDLPEDPDEFDTILIRNLDGSLATYTLTIDGNGIQIGTPEGGYTDELTVARAYIEMALVYFGGKWRILV